MDAQTTVLTAFLTSLIIVSSPSSQDRARCQSSESLSSISDSTKLTERQLERFSRARLAPASTDIKE